MDTMIMRTRLNILLYALCLFGSQFYILLKSVQPLRTQLSDTTKRLALFLLYKREIWSHIIKSAVGLCISSHMQKTTVSPTEISSFCRNIWLYSGQICRYCWRMKLRKVSLRYSRLWSSCNPASCSKLCLKEKNERKRQEACSGWAAPW